MDHVALDDVVVERAARVSSERATVVAGSEEEPLILASDTPVRIALLTFALEDSNFPFQSSFPVFLSNAVNWLAGTEVMASTLSTVAVPVASAVVRNHEGQDVPTRQSRGRTSFSPDEPGLYTVTGAEGELVVSANLLNPRITAVNDSALAGSEPGKRPSAEGEPSGGGSELWIGLVIGALALLLFEWWTYHRRLTV
jgi:hypothetical protein